MNIKDIKKKLKYHKKKIRNIWQMKKKKGKCQNIKIQEYKM